jgi:oligopeptidase B
MSYPSAKQLPHKVYFGELNDDEYRGEDLMNPPVFIEDSYFWMRDETRSKPEVIDYIKSENSYTKSIMDKNSNLTEELFQEIKSHDNEDYSSYPYPCGDGGYNSKYRYFTKNVKGKSYKIYCRINMETNTEEVLLDVNELAQDKEQCDVSSFDISPNHQIMSYGVDYDGSELYEMKFYDLEKKMYLPIEFEKICYGDYCWYDNNTIYYAKGDKANRMYQIWVYEFENNSHKLLFQEDDELFSASVNISDDNKYVFINSNSSYSNEYYIIDPSKNAYEMQIVQKRIDKMLYDIEHHNGILLIRTNKDNSTNFKIMKTTLDKLTCDNWIDFIPHDPKVFIQSICVFSNHIVIPIKYSGNTYINIINYDGNYDIINRYNIPIDDIKVLSLDNNAVYSTNKLRISVTSLTSPIKIYEFDMNTKEFTLLKDKIIPNYDESLYESKRIYVKSHDGVEVPVSLVYRRDKFNHDGTNKLLLYGYGAYGIIIDPEFDKNILPLLDRGFVYAIAHVRGGGFLGYSWYLDGKMKNKINSFKDFCACAEHLIQNKYTFEKGITIEGRSAGGLLVGASMTMRPDLFRTVIAGVPFVDVMNSMCDPTIPLTCNEWEEWGNPNNKEYFDCMIQYSPYDNIKNVEYPNLLLVSGINDPRVQYWEPLKFIAKLRNFKKDNNVQILKLDMNEGHFGGSDRYKYMKEIAFMYTFILSTY